MIAFLVLVFPAAVAVLWAGGCYIGLVRGPRAERIQTVRTISGQASILLLLALVLTQALGAAQPGATDTVFNRRFIPQIRPQMTYEQMVRVVGVPGVLIGEEKTGKSPVFRYRWEGGKKSALTVRVAGGRILDAAMSAPNGHTYAIGSNGAVKDLGRN